MTTALIVALTYYVIYVVDNSLAWQALVRPIVTGPIVGLVLGDLQTGIIMGGLIEAIYMGVVSIGGGAPADAFGATVITVAFVISGGLSLEAGLALAFPIGTLTSRLNQLIIPMHGFFIGIFEKFSAEGNTRGYAIMHQSYRFFARSIHLVVIFLAVWLGAEAVTNVFNQLPPYAVAGLQIAGRMLPAVGLGILTSMIFNKELGGFFFVGYVLSAYMGLGTMGIAILAGGVAVVFFYIDVEKNSKLASNTAKNDGEDFFE